MYTCTYLPRCALVDNCGESEGSHGPVLILHGMVPQDLHKVLVAIVLHQVSLAGLREGRECV